MKPFMIRFFILSIFSTSLKANIFEVAINEDFQDPRSLSLVTTVLHDTDYVNEQTAYTAQSHQDQDEKKSLTGLPEELKANLAEYLSVEDLGNLLHVFKGGNNFDQPHVWGVLTKQFKRDYPTLEATKENVIRCTLRVRVNAESDPEKISAFMSKYKDYDLNKDLPFQEIRDLVNLHNCEMIDVLVAQGNLTAMAKKIMGCSYGWYGYDINPQEADRIHAELMTQSGQKEEKKPDEIFVEVDPQSMIFSIRKLLSEDCMFFGLSTYDFIQKIQELDFETQLRNILKFEQRRNEDMSIFMNATIENATQKGEGCGYYLKALGLKLGLFGFTKNPDKARQYILENNIPY